MTYRCWTLIILCIMLSSLFAITHPTWYWTHVLIVTLLSSKPCEWFTWVHVNDAKTCVWHKRFWTYFQLECLNKISMQKRTCTVKHTEATQALKKIQPDKYKNSSIRHYMCFFNRNPPSYPTIVWLNFFFFLKRNIMTATDLQTNLLSTSCWLGRHLCPQYKMTPTKYPPLLYPPFLSEGKGREEGRQERGWQQQLGGGQATRGRELTHMWQDQAVLLMGREKYRNFKYKADMWLSSNPAVSHLLCSWQAQISVKSNEKMQWNHPK